MRAIALALVVSLFVADYAEARIIRIRTARGVYTYYGRGGRSAARAAANRYYARRYRPRRNTTPVQRDVKQKATLAPVVFPTVTALGGVLIADKIEPAQKPAQKATQKATQKADAAHGHKHRKHLFAGLKARRAARKARRAK